MKILSLHRIWKKVKNCRLCNTKKFYVVNLCGDILLSDFEQKQINDNDYFIVRIKSMMLEFHIVGVKYLMIHCYLPKMFTLYYNSFITPVTF